MRGLGPRIFFARGVLAACKTLWYFDPAAREPILARREEHMKLARIITIAMTVVFSTGVALAPWTPVSAEDAASGKTTKDKDKPKKPHKKVAKTEKTDKAATPGGQTKEGGGGKY
jgi:hypothetical protein